MTASEVPIPRRSRPPLIAALRILLPAVALLTLLAVIGTAAANAYHASEIHTAPTRPIELIGPQLTGKDSKNRPFVITAVTAERENDTATSRIRLHSPVLVRDPGGADQMRVTANNGVYDETAGRLDLTGDVKLANKSGSSTSPSATYDAKTGEVLGAEAVQAAGGSSRVQANSFAVTNKGDSVVYKGGVHTRLVPKKK
jgi:lipopolysaccharide export system protein LptC